MDEQKKLLLEKSATFIIPVRIESEDRLRNLKTSLSFLKNNFKNSKIILKEADITSKVKDNINLDNINYIFEYDNNSFFHRTKILNEMTMTADTEIVINYDLDVLIELDAFYESCDMIINQNYDLIYPYGSGMYCRHINYDNFKDILTREKFNPLEINSHNGPSEKGHVKFHKTSSYRKAGMENEEFISWGDEDNEIHCRFEKLGYKIGRLNRYVFHIEHSRTENSNENNPFFKNNNRIFNFVKNLSKDQMIEYCANLAYMKKYKI